MLAVNAAKNGQLPEELRKLALPANKAYCENDAEALLQLLKVYCPYVYRRAGCRGVGVRSVRELILCLGDALDDPYVKAWVDYLDQRYNYIRGDQKFDPTKIQIRDHEKIEVGFIGLTTYVADHVCYWLAAAEIYLSVENQLRKRGRPISPASKTQLVRDELSRENLNVQK